MISSKKCVDHQKLYGYVNRCSSYSKEDCLWPWIYFFLNAVENIWLAKLLFIVLEFKKCPERKVFLSDFKLARNKLFLAHPRIHFKSSNCAKACSLRKITIQKLLRWGHYLLLQFSAREKKKLKLTVIQNAFYLWMQLKMNSHIIKCCLQSMSVSGLYFQCADECLNFHHCYLLALRSYCLPPVMVLFTKLPLRQNAISMLNRKILHTNLLD